MTANLIGIHLPVHRLKVRKEVNLVGFLQRRQHSGQTFFIVFNFEISKQSCVGSLTQETKSIDNLPLVVHNLTRISIKIVFLGNFIKLIVL